MGIVRALNTHPFVFRNADPTQGFLGGGPGDCSPEGGAPSSHTYVHTMDNLEMYGGEHASSTHTHGAEVGFKPTTPEVRGKHANH